MYLRQEGVNTLYLQLETRQSREFTPWVVVSWSNSPLLVLAITEYEGLALPLCVVRSRNRSDRDTQSFARVQKI